MELVERLGNARGNEAGGVCYLVEEEAHGEEGFAMVEGFVGAGAAAVGEVEFGGFVV